jgi:organic hydroperoxide reductase OsmC/OhrA
MRVRLTISPTAKLVFREGEVAQALVEGAHQACPYSKATRGNIDVVTNLVQAGTVADVA